MKTPEAAVTTALLLAAIVGIGDVPAPRDRWEDGWQAALRQPPDGGEGSAVRVAALREPGSEYERGYRDGALHLGARDGSP